jgi:GntR family transcriptional regulator/MocR family aminotransferase
VLEAYAHLAAEGWIVGRRGSGTAVAATGTTAVDDDAAESAPVTWRHDLRAGRPDPSSFPRTAWVRALRRALATAPDAALGLGDAVGRLELREQLAAYLARSRGLRVGAAQVVVTTGFTQSLGLVARMLVARGATSLAMEDPCMPHHRQIVAAAGLAIEPLAVDADGADVDALGSPAAVLLTPNRQHPLGMALAPARRSRLLEWARTTGAFVIEDDYDGEFRYDGAPIGALQGLEPRHVVYAGTTSKTLAAGLRLGWLVLPPELVEPAVAQKHLVDWQTGVLDQLALAELIATGEYDRHVRKLRLRYRRRRDLLLAALVGHVPADRIGGTAAGLNLHVLVDGADAERELVAAAAANGVALEGLVTGRYPHRGDDESRAGLVVGYAAPPEHGYAAAVRALVETIAR